MVFVDIVTQPGLGPLRGSMDFTFRDDSLNARNAFQREKGPEQTQQYTFNLSGTLRKERTSFSLSAGGASLYDSANIYAATADGHAQAAPIRRPSDRINFNGRLDHALTKAHTLRANFQQNGNDQRNLGVGGFDLPERAFVADDRRQHAAAVGERAAGADLFGEIAPAGAPTGRPTSLVATRSADRPRARRLHRRRRAAGRRPAQPPTSSGRPTSTGRAAGTRSASARWSRAAGTAATTATNYLGTFTFASLEDYEAGTAVELHAAHRQSAGRVLALAGRPLHPGRLARAQEPDAERRPAPGAPDAPRRSTGTWRRAAGFTWSPFKNGKTTVRGGGGIFYEWLEAGHLRADAARRRRPPAGSRRHQSRAIPIRSAAASPGGPAAEQVHARRRPGDADARAWANVGLSQQFSPTFGMNVELQPHDAAATGCAAATSTRRIDGVRPDPASATSRRSSRPRACAALRCTPASTSTCRHGGSFSSPTTRWSTSRTMRTARSACRPTATTSPPSGARRRACRGTSPARWSTLPLPYRASASA